jgi:hypothetical protein
MDTDRKIYSFSRIVRQEEEGHYLMVPFSMPEQAEKIEISYEYDRENGIIDFGLSDADGEFVGWSGSDRNSITVCEYGSSAGFADTAIKPGTWNVILGAYHVANPSTEVKYRLAVYGKHRQLLKGDTHIHSTGSDGKLRAAEIREEAIGKQLDYIFLTDHNNFQKSVQGLSGGEITVIPGVEWTHYKGHAGLLGVTKPFKNFIAESEEDTERIIREAHEAGATVSLNHPFCPSCGWKWKMDVPYDLIEIWNGGLSCEANQRCADWWEKKLKAGYRIPVIGGSDFHSAGPGREIAMPCTFVRAMSRSAADILEAMRGGHSFVSISPQGPTAGILTDGVEFGDEVGRDTDISVKFEHLKEDDEVYLVSESGREKLPVHNGEALLDHEKIMTRTKYCFAEVYRKFPSDGISRMIMITNPIYASGKKE